MSDVVILDKKNKVAEAVNEILFDFFVFGLGSFIWWSIVCMAMGQAEPWLGGVALAAWTFGIATTVHCLQTDAGAIMIGMICLFCLGIVAGILYLFYWLLFLA